jgi:hypothetical protein
MNMKKPLLVVLMAAMLFLPGSAAWARTELLPHGYLTMYESVSPDGSWVEADVSHLTGIADTPVVNQIAEFGSVTATLTGSDNSTGFLVLGTRYLQLLELGNPDVVSDVVKLVANPVAYSDGRYIQTFTVGFYADGYSDGEINFAALVAAAAGSPTLGETGDQQDVSGADLLNTAPAFNLYVTYDPSETFEPIILSREIPLPGTLVLLGSALLGLIVMGWQKKQH